MIDRPEKIRSLIEASKHVLRNVVLQNGAIVRANAPTEPGSHPVASQDRQVWPREAAIIVVAAEKLGIHAAEKFFHWLEDKPEDFETSRLLYANYATNGRIGTLGRMFQPDQMGTVLWAIDSVTDGNRDRALPFRNLIQRLGDGLTGTWNQSEFLLDTYDLWSERPRPAGNQPGNLTYALASSSYGLLRAHALVNNPAWKKTAQQMRKQLKAAYSARQKTYLRRGQPSDDSIQDASLLGLVWPFQELKPDSDRATAIINAIETTLVRDGGLQRFQYDYLETDGSGRDQGGTWPALNFWMAIVLARAGQTERAEAYLHWVIDRVTTQIPRQLFPDFRRGITPDAWSHAMFILACDHLNIPLSA